MVNHFAVCPEGKYGDGCALQCGQCIHGDCDPVSGSCVCHGGWEGATCNQGIISLRVIILRGKLPHDMPRVPTKYVYAD